VSVDVGVVFVVFGQEITLERAAALASEHGFAHLDVPTDWPEPAEAPAVPIGDRISTRQPSTGATWAPMRPMASSEFVGALRDCPGCRPETLPVGPLKTVERVREIARQVPGLRVTVDTGHLAANGEDPLELVDLAGHVQLRQAAPGRPQLHVEEGGDVDFRELLHRLDAVGYAGRLSVEYFDLPDLGFPLEDPLRCAVDLAAFIRSF